MIEFIQRHIPGKRKVTHEDKEELEYLIWLYQQQYDFFYHHPLYSGEEHFRQLKGYRDRVVAARAELADVLEKLKRNNTK